MPPRRRKRTALSDTRPFKIMLPPDISARIDEKAKQTGWPLNRVIINELAAFPNLETTGNLAEHVSALETLLARYGGRITWLELSEQLLNSVDAVLAAEGGKLPAAIDRLRAARAVMLKLERTQGKQ